MNYDETTTPILVDRINEELKRSVRRLDNDLWRITAKVIEYHKLATIPPSTEYMNLAPVETLRSTVEIYKDLANHLDAEITNLERLANSALAEIEEEDDPDREEYQEEEIYF